jgi:hypothetical protein
VKGLDDRHTLSSGGIIERRRKQRENIVTMNNVRPLHTEQAQHRTIRIMVPNCATGQSCSPAANCPIVRRISQHCVSLALKQAPLVFKDTIFSPRLLIEVMAKKNLHYVRIHHNNPPL